MLNVGLVGFGFAGKVFHAPVIRAVKGLRLTTIVRRSGGMGAWGGDAGDARYADVDFVRSVDELLTRPVDLVVIATPNTSHHPIAKQSLLAGRHVVYVPVKGEEERQRVVGVLRAPGWPAPAPHPQVDDRGSPWRAKLDCGKHDG